MTEPPLPLPPSGLAAHTISYLGHSLMIRCAGGWGWSVERDGQIESLDDFKLTGAVIEVIPEEFVPFRTDRGGIHGRVVNCPEGYHFTRFLAFTMADGTEYGFTDEVATPWRIIFANGVPDYSSHWFPLLSGEPRYFGYGSISP